MELMLGNTAAPRVTIASVGLTPMEGWGIADETAAIIDRLGGRSGGHTASKVHVEDLAAAMLVLTATRSQRSRVVQLYPPAVQYTFTIRQAGQVLATAFPAGVPGPMPGLSPAQKLAGVTDLLRSNRHRLAGTNEFHDVIDPFAKPPKVHAQAASEMLPALNLLAQGLGGTPLELPTSLALAQVRGPRRRGRRSVR